MEIDLRPHSATPLPVSGPEYDALVAKRDGGWSHCATEVEWLAKLHYLRSGLRLGKLDAAQFDERETRLVEAWLKKLPR